MQISQSASFSSFIFLVLYGTLALQDHILQATIPRYARPHALYESTKGHWKSRRRKGSPLPKSRALVIRIGTRELSGFLLAHHERRKPRYLARPAIMRWQVDSDKRPESRLRVNGEDSDEVMPRIECFGTRKTSHSKFTSCTKKEIVRSAPPEPKSMLRTSSTTPELSFVAH
jgi:hypothetical protein